MSLPDHMRMMVPLIIDFTGKKVIIFGGGDVAARKAAYFKGCTTTVISRSFSESLEHMDVERRMMDLEEVPDDEIRSLINGAFLVIAATSDRHINNRIGYLCRDVQVLFNNADGIPGDATLPAILEGKNFLIAVATYGRSPAFSHYIRSQLESSKIVYERMIDLQEKLRTTLKSSLGSQEQRRTILGEVIADPLVWEALETDHSAAWALIERKYLHER
jgi:precorrin-2 dehydrogenase/sirohydrochlorin ferrochelatase